jgi:hypothetical protein
MRGRHALNIVAQLTQEFSDVVVHWNQSDPGDRSFSLA